MKTNNEILESAILGGLIGASLGALITNSKNGAGIGALAGAAVLASMKANENARKTDIPLLLEENNALYEIKKDGSKRFIKAIPKHSRHVPKRFTLR